jgi:hypothetical protein
MLRKLGGFTFQELALPLDDLRDMTSGGPDLSYDFFTRPPTITRWRREMRGSSV